MTNPTWQDYPLLTTPITAATLNDLEGRANLGGGYVNAQNTKYAGGAKGDGVTDDTAAILAALADLPTYAGGVGSGRVILPPTPTNAYKVSANIPLGAGRYLVGGGMLAPVIKGNIAGDLITVTGDFGGLENLCAQNTSSNIAGRALTVNTGVSNFTARRVYFNASCVGGPIVHVNAAILSEFSHCKAGGAGSQVCDVGFLCDNGANITRFISTSASDAKSGIAVWGAYGLYIAGGHFESLAGGGTYDAALALSGVFGGAVIGDYFEATPSYGIAFYGNIAYSSGLLVGGHSMQSPGGGSFIDLAFAQDTVVLPNDMLPGGANPNVNGVFNSGSKAHTNVVYPQNLRSGTGAEVVGGSIRRAGNGSPEGVVVAGVGSFYQRNDGGAGTTFYTKETGTGSTGWKPVQTVGPWTAFPYNTTNFQDNPGDQPLQYRINGSDVELRGVAVSKAGITVTFTTTVIGTLPAGARPAVAGIQFPVYVYDNNGIGGTIAQVQIASSGDLVVWRDLTGRTQTRTSPYYVTLNNLKFSTL